MGSLKSIDQILLSLGPTEAVDLFRHLLWCEADRVGFGRNLVKSSMNINESDGGIDALIIRANPNSEDIIPSGTSIYQIKARDLDPWECKEELYLDKPRTTKRKLKPKINFYLKEGGTYVLVLYADLTSIKQADREKALNEALKPFFPKPRVRLYSLSQLVSFLERFPSLIYWLDPTKSEMQHYESWGKNDDVLFPKAFILEKKRDIFCKAVRKYLRDTKIHSYAIRLIGRSGIGKTRTLFEALSPDDIKYKVIYQRAKKFITSNFYNLLINDVINNCIIVIDECSSDIHRILANEVIHKGNNNCLITVGFPENQEFEQIVDNNPLFFHLDELPQKSIRELISCEVPDVPELVLEKIAQFAAGYPRVAVSLIKQYKSNPLNWDPDKIQITDELLVNRLIGGNLNPNSQQFLELRTVCRYLSLFPWIGFAGNRENDFIEISIKYGYPVGLNRKSSFIDLANHSKWLASQAGLRWVRFQEIISYLRKQEVIQGENLISLLPYPLSQYLINEWWDIHGNSIVEFLNSIPPELEKEILFSFYLNMGEANLHNQNRYTLIIKFLKNEIHRKKSISELVYFLFKKFNDIQPNDRKAILSDFIQNTGTDREVFVNIISDPQSTIPIKDREEIIETLIRNPNSRLIILSTTMHLFKIIKLDLVLFIISKLFAYCDDPQIRGGLTDLILRHYVNFPSEYQEKVWNLLDVLGTNREYSQYILCIFPGLSENHKSRILEILVEKNDYQSLLYLLLPFYKEGNMIPEAIKSKLLLTISKFEDSSQFLFLFISSNIDSIDEGLLTQLIENIAKFQGDEGKVIRKSLSANPKIPPYLRDQIKLKEEDLTSSVLVFEKKKIEDISQIFINQLRNTERLVASEWLSLKGDWQPEDIKLLLLSNKLYQYKRGDNNLFYNPFSRKRNILFVSMMSILFPHLDLSKPRERYKALKHFCDKGFFLEDIFSIEIPDSNPDDNLLFWFEQEFKTRLITLISHNTPIIIIGIHLFDLLKPKLDQLGYLVLNSQGIPIPSTSNQKDFQEIFQKTIEKYEK